MLTAGQQDLRKAVVLLGGRVTVGRLHAQATCRAPFEVLVFYGWTAGAHV